MILLYLYFHTELTLKVFEHDDPLRLILTELDGVPNLGTEELNDARDRAITLELTNRFALVKGLSTSATLIATI